MDTNHTTDDSHRNKTNDPKQEITDAQRIFRTVWDELEAELGADHMRFPKEILWLGGAPGAGKGTNTPFILRERGITAPPIEMSSLLNSPEMQAIKDTGRLVGDCEVTTLLFRQLLKPEYEAGVVVDGYPRTAVQVECVTMLYDRMIELRQRFFATPAGPMFRRPIFRVVLLFVSEQTAIERQLHRGRKIADHNQRVRKSGKGCLLEERATDLDEGLARDRYQTFKDHTYDALQSLRHHFHYHVINADGPIAEVEAAIANEFAYQSALELGQDTHDTIRRVPLAAQIIVHARQELVRRLDNYQHRYGELFSKIVTLLADEFVPVLGRHAFAGRATVRCQNPLFDDAMAVDMVIDVLSERGFQVTYHLEHSAIPERVEAATGRISSLELHVHRFDCRFPAAEIRRGH